MATMAASRIDIPVQLPLVKNGFRSKACNAKDKLSATSNRVNIRDKSQPLDSTRFKLNVQCQSLDRLRPTMSSIRKHPASSICAAASSATCAAVQTKSETKKPGTTTRTPTRARGETKVPKLDDGGIGFPPFNGGGGGGGGGGENFSGGFYLFSFLIFLSFLKEKEEEAGIFCSGCRRRREQF